MDNVGVVIVTVLITVLEQVPESPPPVMSSPVIVGLEAFGEQGVSTAITIVTVPLAGIEFTVNAGFMSPETALVDTPALLNPEFKEEN